MYVCLSHGVNPRTSSHSKACSGISRQKIQIKVSSKLLSYQGHCLFRECIASSIIFTIISLTAVFSSIYSAHCRCFQRCSFICLFYLCLFYGKVAFWQLFQLNEYEWMNDSDVLYCTVPRCQTVYSPLCSAKCFFLSKNSSTPRRLGRLLRTNFALLKPL